MPYAALVYGADGTTWVYATDGDPLRFRRQVVEVATVDGGPSDPHQGSGGRHRDRGGSAPSSSTAPSSRSATDMMRWIILTSLRFRTLVVFGRARR